MLFVFGNSITCGVDVTLAKSEVPLSQAIMGYWGSMARTGDPNGEGRFAWPSYDTVTEPMIVLDTPLSTTNAVEKEKCDFWDGLAR